MIDCEPGATIILHDAASVANGARLRLRTLVRVDGRERFYDAVDLGAGAPPAIGTFAAIGRPFDRHACDALAVASNEVRIGVGVLPEGIFARAIGPAVWPVTEALRTLRAALRSAETAPLA